MPRTKKMSIPKSAWPAPIYEVTELEQLRVLSVPLRLRILNTLFGQPQTVKQVADRLELPATNLYYHVNELERIGVVEIVETRVKSGIIEKYYKTTAATIHVSRDLLRLTDEAAANVTYGELLASIMEAVADDLRLSVASGLLSPPAEGAPKLSALGRTNVRLNRGTAARFARKINKLLEEVEAADDATGEMEFGCAIAYFPLKYLKPAEEPSHD
jgi:DNA-binding transcriptional ArsR family regulator